MTVRFGVLGPLEVWSDGETVPIRGPKRRGLLAYLLAHASEPQPPDRIVDAVWGTAASTGSEATVQTYVSQLRKLFGVNGPPIEYRAGGYVLDLNADTLDATRFETAVAAASALDDRDRRLALLEGALSLWRGEPLAEFKGQSWADDRARQWTRLHVLAHQLRTAALLDTGHHRDALAELERLVATHPLHEPFWSQLVLARYRCGQPADALAAAGEARKVLAIELGIEPGPELIELERKVLAHDESLAWQTRITAPANIPVMTVVEPLPDGVVTFLLTDIVDSTALWEAHPEEMAKALARHEDVVADVAHEHGGRLLKSRGEGDATLSVFAKATDAVTAAVALQRRLGNEAWPGRIDLPTRIALHTGEAQLRNGDYYGGTINRAARIRGLAAGGQVFVSRAVHDLVIDVLPTDLEIVGIGDKQMKGLQRRESLYEIRGAGLERATADTERPSSLGRRAANDLLAQQRGSGVDAQPLSSLIGRTDVIARMSDALDGSRCLTLVGAGGVGKTRLLEEACARFGDRFERVWRIDLATARDRTGVEHLLDVGLLPPRDPMNRSRDDGPQADLLSEIASTFRGRRVLVALDNCEQLIDVLPDMIEALLARTAQLTVLATSREPLAFQGEIVLPVAPLGVPPTVPLIEPSQLLHVESVELLTTRARERGAELAITSETADDIASICRQLDGIPLALELAAARLVSTSLADLCARLPHQLDLLANRHGDVRRRTLRGAIGWSFELLEPAEQTLLLRLGIFAGGFTLDAAEEVCADDAVAATATVYLNLAELVAKSVVVFDRQTGRYRLLEPIRQFARELLEVSGELPLIADQHTRWAFRYSMNAGASSGMQRRFEVELDNIHAALDWLQSHDAKQFLRFVSLLGYSWCFIDWRRGRAVAEVAVTMATDVSERLRAGVLLTRGIVEIQHDLFGSSVWLDQARDLYRRNDEQLGVAWSTFFLAGAYTERRPDETQRLYLESVERFHDLGVATGEMWALLDLTVLAQNHGRIDEATDHLERMVALAEHSDQSSLHGVALALRARNTAARGDADAASREMQEAIEMMQANDERFNLQRALSEAAWFELQAGRVAAAEDYVRRALRLGLEIEHQQGLRISLVMLAVVESRHGNNERARLLLAATGWDRPQLTAPPHAVWVRAIEQLEHLRNDEDEAATREGRALGVFGAARASIT